MTTKIHAFGLPDATHAIADLLVQYGATLTIGYNGPKMAPAGTPVILFAQAHWPESRTVRGESAPTTDYDLGLATAYQRLLEQLGATCTILDAR